MLTRTVPSSLFPKRRAALKSGIARAPQREFPRHRKFVRSHHCVVPGCENLDIECCHIRSAFDAGMGLKSADWRTFPACRFHHAQQHSIGQGSFEDRHGLDLDAIAGELARRSPDKNMRLALLEATLDLPANPLGLIPIVTPPQGEASPHANPDIGRKPQDFTVAHPLIPIRGRPGYPSPVLRNLETRDAESLHRPGASGRGQDRQPAEVAGPAPRAGNLAGSDLALVEGRLDQQLADELRAILFRPAKRAREGDKARVHALLLWRGLAEDDIGDFIRITPAGRGVVRAALADEWSAA